MSFDTLISTLEGNEDMTDLRPGMSVFTLVINGNKVIKPIELVSKVSVSDSHLVCHLNLNDVREPGSSRRPTDVSMLKRILRQANQSTTVYLTPLVTGVTSW